MTDGAEEVRLDLRAGEELLVDAGIVEARHGTAIQPQRARRQDEIGALQCAVPEGRRLGELGILEPVLGAGIVREQPRDVLGEIEVVADDRGRGCVCLRKN